jgi:hypothetical protein
MLRIWEKDSTLKKQQIKYHLGNDSSFLTGRRHLTSGKYRIKKSDLAGKKKKKNYTRQRVHVQSQIRISRSVKARWIF